MTEHIRAQKKVLVKKERNEEPQVRGKGGEEAGEGENLLHWQFCGQVWFLSPIHSLFLPEKPIPRLLHMPFMLQLHHKS